jgi:hypothetical protein
MSASMCRAQWFAVLTLACVARPASAADHALAPEEISEGWILLFDGQTTFGWEAGSDANWKVQDGVLAASAGKPGLLCTTSEFADYVLKVDFRCPRPTEGAAATNSGVFLRTPLKPTDPAKDCYELNIASPPPEPATGGFVNPRWSPFPTGSLVNRQRGEYRPAEGWQSYEVTAVGGHFVIKLNGQTVLDYTDPQPVLRGRIGLQYRFGPIEFRNVKLKPLSLQSIFNGRDLAGWKPFAGQKSVYSVTPAGELNVKNGRGQLESAGQYGDFVLQLEVFSNGRQLNSGVFFRSIPGEFQNGYELQVQNGFKDGDRSQPVDFGTGAIYRRQPARKVMGDDFRWVAMTLAASGNHMASWVDGYQVTDWTDTRPPQDNPRKGLRTAPGTFIIQGHDPTTDLSFRKLRVAELPAP